MKYLLLLAMVFAVLCPLSAAAQFNVIGEAETNWPGIHYQLFWLKRLPPDRLVVGVRILATSQAPLGGTLIGYPVAIPPNPSAYDLRMGNYRPKPFSLTSSMMSDDTTHQQFSVLPPISPPGREYRPAVILGTLTPGQALVLTLQFAIPPPPPSNPGQMAVKQTVSFFFNNAKGLIGKISVPPEDNASK